MEFDLPLYAVQRQADGTWLVRSPMGDPLWPAVDVVAVIDAQASAAPRPARLEQQDATTGQIGGIRLLLAQYPYNSFHDWHFEILFIVAIPRLGNACFGAPGRLG
jgi:hypothetical protein